MGNHTRLWLFVAMQLSVMMSMIDILIKIELSHKHRKAELILNFYLSGLAYSPLLSASAISSLFYGYGLVYLNTAGCLDNFLSRIRKASLSVWDRFGYVMFLPWLLGVGQGLFHFPYYEVEDAYDIGTINFKLDFWYFRLVLALGSFLMAFRLLLTLGSFLIAFRVYRQMIRSRYIQNIEPEILDYARRINELAGFEIILLDT
ncbi:hypothetical protein KR059_009268 [Drosophila kikkawai]|nr:hypothetical protein KR059_009268 [Drosophila kikkawai]